MQDYAVPNPKQQDKLVDWGYSGGKAFLMVAGYIVAVEGATCHDMHLPVEDGLSVSEAFFSHHVWTREWIEKVATKATR